MQLAPGQVSGLRSTDLRTQWMNAFAWGLLSTATVVEAATLLLLVGLPLTRHFVDSTRWRSVSEDKMLHISYVHLRNICSSLL